MFVHPIQLLHLLYSNDLIAQRAVHNHQAAGPPRSARARESRYTQKRNRVGQNKADANFDMVCSHNQNKIDCSSVKKLEDIKTDQYTKCKYIIIDEAQFFEDLYDFVTVAVDINQKHVIIVGLNGDSNRENFGEIYKLYPLADKIDLLTALCSICKDGTKAIFSKKIVENNKQTDIGSVDKYIPVCRKHFYNQ